MLGSLDERLAEVAREAGIRVVDLSSIATNQDYELPDGLRHFNDAGSEALARKIASALKAFRRDIEPTPAAQTIGEVDEAVLQ